MKYYVVTDAHRSEIDKLSPIFNHTKIHAFLSDSALSYEHKERDADGNKIHRFTAIVRNVGDVSFNDKAIEFTIAINNSAEFVKAIKVNSQNVYGDDDLSSHSLSVLAEAFYKAKNYVVYKTNSFDKSNFSLSSFINDKWSFLYNLTGYIEGFDTFKVRSASDNYRFIFTPKGSKLEITLDKSFTEYSLVVYDTEEDKTIVSLKQPIISTSETIFGRVYVDAYETLKFMYENKLIQEV